MDSSRFEFLPDEINLQFLNKLPYSDLINACQAPGLSHLFDWDFWRKKAEKDLNVPEWYFNLPFLQNREVSGDQRFLEISSKFCISDYSVARIENGKVEGIYSEHTARFLAIKQGDEYLFSLDKKQEKRAGMIDKLRRAKVPNPEYYFDLAKEKHSLELDNMAFCSQLIKSKNTELIRDCLKGDDKKKASLLCGMMAASGDENTFPLVEDYFVGEKASRFSILNFSLMSHKPEQFIKLFLKSALTYAMSLKALLLKKAYFTANIGCISFLENQGVQLEQEEKFKLLDKGYLYNPRPVEVYQIVQELGPRRSVIPHLQGLETDVDIQILQIGNNLSLMRDKIIIREFTVPLVRHYIAFFRQRGNFVLLRKLCSDENSEIKVQLFAEIGIECPKRDFLSQQTEVMNEGKPTLMLDGRFFHY